MKTFLGLTLLASSLVLELIAISSRDAFAMAQACFTLILALEFLK